MAEHLQYVFVTFAPIQGFIEKSRKLRDLYGASLILSYLTRKLIEAIPAESQLISPGIPNYTRELRSSQPPTYTKGLPNRILVKGDFPEQVASDALLNAWGNILEQSRIWLEEEVKTFCQSYNSDDDEIRKFCQHINSNNNFYTWKQEWDKWKNHTWELFRGTGDTADAARQDLERRKLSRRWTAINWIGESSSISGADAIAYPRLEAKDIKLKDGFPSREHDIIKGFYKTLAAMFDIDRSQWEQMPENREIEGKFIADNERLSIPELVKRLVTHSQVAERIGIISPEPYRDIVRKTENHLYWTGWFMGDGDNMGEHLKTVANTQGDKGLTTLSNILRDWGRRLYNQLPREMGRIIYAGGDDFLGIIYSGEQQQIPGYQALEQLIQIHQTWQHIQPQLLCLTNEKVTLSVGFVWAGGAVPQRDVLQHCREAEQISKKRGKNRVTMRILFNNGQYIDWTTPWEYLDILNHYQDLDGGSNWSHVYGDLAQLKSRHAFGLADDLNSSDENQSEYNQLLYEFCQGFLNFVDIYFPNYKTTETEQTTKEVIESHQFEIHNQAQSQVDCDRETIRWVEGLISVGWHLLGDRNNYSEQG